MEKLKISIAYLEPSDLLYEGVTNILHKSAHKYYFSRAITLEELSDLLVEGEYQLAIVNPVALLNLSNDFMRIKKQHPATVWVALSYSYIDPTLLNNFAGVISLNDSAVEINVMIENLARQFSGSHPVKEELTQRERDVLKHLVNGESNKEISERLNISIHTVISHRKNIVRKTGIKSLSGLAIYAITSKILELPHFIVS